MDEHETQVRLIEILKEAMKLMNPEEEYPEILSNTVPLFELPSFDSIMGVCSTITCFERFGITDEKTQSVFVEELPNGKHKALTVKEIVIKIINLKSNSSK